MATVDSKPPLHGQPPRRGQSLTGKIGGTGAWLLMLAIMAAIIIALALTVTQANDQPTAAEAQVVEDPAGEPAGALAQLPSPTSSPTSVPKDTPAATSTPTETALPTATATITPTALPPTPTTSGGTEGPAALGEMTVTLPVTATPLPMPTPRDVYSWTLEVPILMYHYVSEPPDDADKYRLDLSTTPQLFREQLQFLLENGYETVDLYDLTLAIVNKGELPDKPVIITLDDGYRDNYENAFPILQELGMTATFFVTTEFIDNNNPAYMDWVMIEEMSAAGMRIEPHSKTHPDLTIHDRDFIIWEAQGSRETIASHTGQMPRYFAYPGGRYNDEVMQIISELDFWGAVTTANGNWHSFNDRFEWGRVRMRYTTSPAELDDLIS